MRQRRAGRAAGVARRGRPNHARRRCRRARQAKQALEVCIAAQAFLQPEDGRGSPVFQRIEDQVEQRLAVDLRAVVLALEVPAHGVERQRLGRAARPDVLEQALAEGVDAHRRRQEMRGPEAWYAQGMGQRQEMTVEDRPRAVADGMQFDTLGMLVAQRLELAGDVMRAAADVPPGHRRIHRMLRTGFHAAPDARCLQGARTDLDQRVGGEVGQVPRQGTAALPRAAE